MPSKARLLNQLLLAAILLTVLTLWGAPPVRAQNAGAYFITGPNMIDPRFSPKIATLPDGKVVVFGGNGWGEGTLLTTAEYWDSQNPGLFTYTNNNMAYSHLYGAFARLNDGRYLIAGGRCEWLNGVATWSYSDTAELFDPATKTFSRAGNMTYGRSPVSAATLSDGRVLVVGCRGNAGYVYADLYNPATNTFSPTQAINTPRFSPAVLPTSDGKAVVLGGGRVPPTGYFGDWYDIEVVELYDPATNRFTVLKNTLFDGETGWNVSLTPQNFNRSIDSQRLSDGRYLLVATHKNGPNTLFTFNPDTKEIAKFATNPSLSLSNYPFYNQPVVDNAKGRAYLLNQDYWYGTYLRLFTVDLASGARTNPTGYFYTGGAPICANAALTLLSDGRLFMAGGTNWWAYSGEWITRFIKPIVSLLSNAGPAQTVQAGTLVQLEGSNSTPSWDITTFQWSQLSGPTVTLSDPTIARPTFSAPYVASGGASLVFQLTVTNKDGETSQSNCTVTVTWSNQPPVVNPGSYAPVKAGDPVTLDGSGSTDPDDGIKSYSWEQIEGPPVQLNNANTAQATFTAPDVGMEGTTLTFRLTVTDNHNLTSTATCSVSVTWVNQPPVANAGSYAPVKAGDAVTLDGSGSTDPDDGIATYQWTQLSGPPVILSNSEVAQPTFTAPHVKYGGDVLNFQLTVTDRGGLKSSAKCTVSVLWVNTKPVADVGDNVMILSQDQSFTIIQGKALDDDGDPITYRWLKGINELAPSQPVGPDGVVQLNLATIPPLAVGEHFITLEISDGYDTSTDMMVLTVGNSAPLPAPSGEGTYPVNTSVTLGGSVMDYDGDMLTYQWLEDNTVLAGDQVQAMLGGAPVNLPPFVISSFKVGTHNLKLQVSDGVNTEVAKTITVTIIDNVAPTLSPVADTMILWPPNKQMVPVTIRANAMDNSGMPVKLTVAIACNESKDGEVYWTQPVIDQNTGTITMKFMADRFGKGTGRQYTVTITATDDSGNTSTANVKVLVPHDQGKN